MSAARKVIGVVGTSGSGKTTLVEFLVSRLASEGVKVNVIKHSHHDFELEPPRKDSARFRRAGAAEVMIASPYRFAIIHELHNQPEPTMDEQLSRLGPADLTLVEGFHTWPIDKIEVYRRAVGEAPRFESDNTIVAVASDQQRPAGAREALEWLDLNQPEAVLRWLRKNALKP